MTVKTFSLITPLTCVALALATAVAGHRQMPVAGFSELQEGQIVPARDTVPDIDSVPAHRRLTDDASEKFKAFSFKQYDGETEEMLYPMALEVCDAAMKALHAEDSDSDDLTRLEGIFRIIAPVMVKASVFYSTRENSDMMQKMAKNYVDILIEPRLSKVEFKRDERLWPTMVYIASTDAYNSGNYKDALKYFGKYLETGENLRRENVLLFMGQAALIAKIYDPATELLVEGTQSYPANYNMLIIALQLCIDGGHAGLMQPLLDKALMFRPNDEQLLNIQARLFEDNGNFQNALDLYLRLDELKPNNLDINKHLALCYYNLGADYYNRSITAPDEKIAKKYLRQSNSYFTTAANRISAVLATEPSNMKYLRALVMTYGSLGEKEKFEDANSRLAAFGGSRMAFNDSPEMLAVSESGSNFTKSATTSAKEIEVPGYNVFAKKYVEERLARWSLKSEFEKMDDYTKRMADDNVDKEYKKLLKEAQDKYIEKYAHPVSVADMTLSPYDVENETFRIDSEFGPMLVKVPNKNEEAQAFKSSWNAVQPRNAAYDIQNDRIVLSRISFITPSGKSYTYDSGKNLDFALVEVTDIDVNGIIRKYMKSDGTGNVADASATKAVSGVSIRPKSDVDENIPVTTHRIDNTLALIISNENYTQVTPVKYAAGDGETFAEYCRKTLGIPDNRVRYVKDATYGNILGAVRQLGDAAKALGSDTNIIFYYAGHGIPDEGSKDSFILPVDSDGALTEGCYPMKRLYKELGKMSRGDVMVFLDCCFSGAGRDGKMLAPDRRGVALRPRDAAPEGNMFVFAASTGEQTALPYSAKAHGLFTYFLLKKLQTSKGNASLKEIRDYVTENVTSVSTLDMKKPQTPVVTVSGSMTGRIDKKKLRP